MNRILPLALLAAVAGCGPAEPEPTPGAATADEAKAVGEAAAMLDERPPASDAAPEPRADASDAP